MQNNNKRLIFFLLIVILLGAVLYFKNQIPFNSSFVSEENTKENISKSTEDRVVIKDSNDFYNIEASYALDSWDKENKMKNFVENILKIKQEEWKIGGEIHTEEIKLNETFPDRFPMKYELFIDYERKEARGGGVVSYFYKVYEFTGGAHGNTFIQTFSFNQNKILFIEDILDLENGKDISLTRMLESKLASFLGEFNDTEMIRSGLGLAYLKEDGTFDFEKCNCDGFLFSSNFQNFLIEDNGLKFIFGQYQVAPYVAGMPEVVFSFEELSSYLKSF